MELSEGLSIFCYACEQGVDGGDWNRRIVNGTCQAGRLGGILKILVWPGCLVPARGLLGFDSGQKVSADPSITAVSQRSAASINTVRV